MTGPNHQKVKVGLALPEDAAAVFDVQRLTWLATYPNEEIGITYEDVKARIEGQNGELVPAKTERWRNTIATKKNVFVAKLDGKVVGFASYYFDEESQRQNIGALYVLPEAQGLGAGSRLLQKAVATLGRRDDIFLHVASYNHKAIAFYEHHGFVKTGRDATGAVDPLPSGKYIPEIEMVLPRTEMKKIAITKISEKLYSKPPKNGKYYTIAIDGRAGSGKTELAKYLSTLLPDFIFINGDDYFEPTPGEIAWGAFNDDRFINDVIEPLKRGDTSITYRPYDWHNQPHITECPITIGKGICIERSYSLAFNLDWDFKIWVEAPIGVATERAIVRDQMPEDQARRAYEQVWKPKDEVHAFKAKPLQTADVVIDGTKPFAEQVEP